VFHVLELIFTAIGATLILGALTFVSLVIGGLVNGMIVLLSGPVIDEMIEKRKAKTRTA
jgi:ABC-type dipeptide/oligopeptide/nickel transport system permease component